MDALVSQLASITKSNFSSDKTRVALLFAAQKLVQRLELPFERTARMVIREPVTMAAFKTALEMKMFSAIGSESKTCKEIADTIEADPLLVKRIARLLAASSVIDEVDIDTYANTDFSQSMIDPDGLCNGFKYFFDMGLTSDDQIAVISECDRLQEPR